MARPANPHPTDGELEILQALWDQGPSSLGNICEILRRDRDVATTTVATMLKVMLGKVLVKRESTARGYVWSAAVSRGKTATGMVGKIIDGVFEGSAQRLVAHLVESGQLTDTELDELGQLVAAGAKRKKKMRTKGKK